MKETVHILMRLNGFNNVMACGVLNKEVWVSENAVDRYGEMEYVTCDDCVEVYALRKLEELP